MELRRAAPRVGAVEALRSTHRLLLITYYWLHTADGVPRVGAVEAARGKAEVAQLDVTLRV